MKVYLITDYLYVNPVREALNMIALDLGLAVSQTDYLNIEEGIVPQIISSVADADVVVADISNERPNLYYEIGLAHGSGKPVIIVSQMDNFNSLSLLTYNFYKYDISEEGVKKMAFFFRTVLSNPIQIDHLRPGKSSAIITTFANYNSEKTLTDIEAFEGQNKFLEFERWVNGFLSGIPGFEVHHSGFVRGREYDFIVWNNTDDSDLAGLGNPIPIEVKATKNIDSSMINDLVKKGTMQGFRSVILMTMAIRTKHIDAILRDLKKRNAITFLLIDRTELERVNTPEDLFKAFKKSFRESFIS